MYVRSTEKSFFSCTPSTFPLRPVLELSKESRRGRDKSLKTPGNHTPFSVCPSHSKRALRPGDVRTEIHKKLHRGWGGNGEGPKTCRVHLGNRNHAAFEQGKSDIKKCKL